MGGAPRSAAAPVAKASSVSEVDVSPSIVTALNVSATAAFNSPCKAGALSGASVNTNDSIVAMSGAIMPAPLAMPLMTTVAEPSLAVAVATFGNVSVVMIALAALIQMSGRALCTRSPITFSNLLAGRGSPMTPVEASRISLVLHSAAPAASLAVNAVAARPVRPVKALALPELTTSARALPDLSFSRHQSTGAEGHFDRVSTPAAVVPGASNASRTSVRFGYLIP